jgi:hypothetical protein
MAGDTLKELACSARRPRRATFAAVALTMALACGPAGATTVGGSTRTTNGPFVLAGGRIHVPTYSFDDPGEFSGPPGCCVTSTSGVLSFGAHNADWSGPLGLSNAANGPGELASSGKWIAAAWLGPDLRSGLLEGGQIGAPATHSTNGSVGALAVAVAPDASRGVAWSDLDGVHLHVVDTADPGEPAAVLTQEQADLVTVVPAEAGTWWVLWRTDSRVFARHVAADGSLGSLRDLAAASETKPPRAPFLDPTGEHALTAVADGSGGLWVGLPRRLLHVTATGISTVASNSRPLVLATGGGRVALFSRTGRRDIRVRLIAGGTKRTIRLVHRGTPIDASVDAVTGTLYLLSIDAKEKVRLTEIVRGGKHSSVAVSFCARRRHGQVAAVNGLVAVACAGRYTEQDSVETGGDYRYGRDQIYALMRGGKALRRQSLFEGYYSY